MHFGDYVLFVADTRTTTYWPVTSVDDTTSKVLETEIGLVTGAGLTQVLHAVNDRLVSDEVRVVDDIKRIVLDEFDRAKAMPWVGASAADLEGFLKRTGWFFSWATARDGVSLLRAGVLQGSMLDDLPEDAVMWLIEPDSVWLIPPAEATAVEVAEFQQRLEQGLLSIEMCETVQDHLVYHSSLCAEVVREAARRYPSVSAHMQVGIHSIAGEIVVSDRFGLDS